MDRRRDATPVRTVSQRRFRHYVDGRVRTQPRSDRSSTRTPPINRSALADVTAAVYVDRAETVVHAARNVLRRQLQRRQRRQNGSDGQRVYVVVGGSVYRHVDRPGRNANHRHRHTRSFVPGRHHGQRASDADANDDTDLHRRTTPDASGTRSHGAERAASVADANVSADADGCAASDLTPRRSAAAAAAGRPATAGSAAVGPSRSSDAAADAGKSAAGSVARSRTSSSAPRSSLSAPRQFLRGTR